MLQIDKETDRQTDAKWTDGRHGFSTSTTVYIAACRTNIINFVILIQN